MRRALVLVVLGGLLAVSGATARTQDTPGVTATKIVTMANATRFRT